MVTIYDLANSALQDILNVFNSSDDTTFNDIVDFLNGRNNKFSGILESYALTTSCDQNMLKKVIMLNLFSYAYLVNLYNVQIDLNSDNSLIYQEYLESLDPKEIINMFSCHSPEIKSFFEDCSSYLTSSYIYRYCCWANMFREGKKSVLFKINPFATLEYQDNQLDEGFVETEVYIQLFDDLHNKAIENSSKDPEVNDDTATEEFDRILIDNFIQIIDEHFNGNFDEISNFYSVIFSNIFENITLNIKANKKQRKKFASLIEKFEEYSLSDLITLFAENYQFAIDIIDLFLMYNTSLEKQELINRRLEFLRKGNREKLAELNPYYESDNQVLKRLKEKSSN